MVDTRFHRLSQTYALHALVGVLPRPVVLDDDRAASFMVLGADELSLAGAGHVALAAHKNYLDDLKATTAGLVIVSAQLRDAVPATSIAIVDDRPHELFADILDALYPASTRGGVGGIAGASTPPFLEEGVSLGPNVVLGEGVEIGRGTVIGANTVIGAGVAVGRNCTIGANVTIDCAYLGGNVVIHPGARIGTEGFGWLDHARSNRKIPQLGRVIVQDDVEIGANATIDRGALGDTVIGEGTKIDNLVQIGHNCRIGRYCLIAAQSGLSGSTVLEDGVLMAGGTGTGGHLTIGAGSVVYGRAGVSKSWPAGSKLFGAPARDIKEYWRETAMLKRMMNKGEQR
ncbi:UDP-3-O-(3-hydroxymyristoyl)glucosamine N-acyltransferase [Devosia sp.]|jgi:UDP-3-O-[3-hydroxymyristoyl] glucosamine N-acyltransferase|uniref:UDP-3-O-(3-hydroxymyristoyl)glucosamine N-acyltransferase n=1 Tax=Devosia sp. TaxID=1871048 RepID=UPI0037C14100